MSEQDKKLESETKQSDTQDHPSTITIRAFVIGAVMAAILAWWGTKFENTPPSHTVLVESQIPVLPYMMVVLIVLLINPFFRLIRFIKQLTVAELMTVFIMCMVTSGISTYGWAGHIVPIIAGLSNPDWNNEQKRWDIYVEPYLRESLFISEPGSREAAKKLRDTTEELRESREVYRIAVDISEGEIRKKEIEAEQKLLIPGTEEGDKKELLLKRQLRVVNASLRFSREMWEEFEGAFDQDEVLETYEKKIEELEALEKTQKEELAAIHSVVFEKIATFRKGLPEELRAVPGIFYIPGEGFTGYRHRLTRLNRGRDALDLVKDAEKNLENGKDSTELLSSAAVILEEISVIPELEKRKTDLERSLEKLKEAENAERIRLGDLRKERRYARVDEFDALDDLIDESSERRKDIKEDIKEIEKEINDSIKPHIAAAARAGTVRESILTFSKKLAADELPAEEIPAEFENIKASFAHFDASLSRFLIGDVPWSEWLRPLFLWGVILFLTYIVLMTFNVLIFRQWAYNEKLVYPLAQLPELMVAKKEESNALPSLFKQGLFWAGFAIAFGILTWNHMAKAKIIPDIKPVPLDFWFLPYLRGSFLHAIHTARFNIIFMLVGLTFLIPARISFSMWFFFIFYLLELIVLVALGLGVYAGSFPQDSELTLSFCTAQGGGALIVFALVTLYKCRQYLFCGVRPGMVSMLEENEQKELRISSILFLAGSLLLVIAFTIILDANFFYSILFYLICLMVTIGMTRAVAEGGVFSVQSNFNPIMFIRHTIGMDKSWSNPVLFAPLWLYHALLFFDLKAFIAPAMANALKMRDDIGMRRLRFHIGVIIAIILAVVVSAMTAIMIGYHRGANSMRHWNYNHFVHRLSLGTIKEMIQTNPIDNGGLKWWLLAGGILMGFILFSRRKFFWMVHPIGLIMLINPLMRGFWGSILMGWGCKVLVTKYGNKQTYERIRGFFIGLIVGEIVAYAIGWHHLVLWWGL